MVDLTVLEDMISSEIQHILGSADYAGILVIALFVVVAAFTRIPMELALVAIVPLLVVLAVLGWLPMWVFVIFLFLAGILMATAWHSWGRK